MASLAGVLPARGESGSAPPADEQILFEDLPSVFGASKYEQKTSEAPAWVTIVTAEEIDTYGYRTLADILRSVPGFYATYDRNYSYLGVRGFLRPGDYNSRVLLLIDGHRTNDNLYDSTYYGNEALVDVDVIERVEVIRGPSASLYGTNAFFAVINIVTKSGRDLKGAEVSAEAASYGTVGGHAAWGARPGAGPESYLAATYGRSHGQDLFFPEFDAAATNDGVAEDADHGRYAKAFGKIAAGPFVFEGVFNSRDKAIPTSAFGTTFNDPRSQTVDTRSYAMVSYESELAPRSHIAASLSYDYYRYDGTYAYPTGLFRDYAHGRWWTADVRVTTSPGKRQKVIAGAEYRDNFIQDQGAYDETGVVFEDRRSSGIWAVYAQDEIHAGPRVLINLGVRHDAYQTFGGTTNPRLAVIATLTPRATLKAMFGRAFRAPTAYELYYDDGNSQKGNAGLNPETIDTYEVAWEQSHAKGLRTVVAVYRYIVDDLITQEADPLDGRFVFNNLDRVKATGADLSLEGRLARRLDLRVSYSFQDSKDMTSGDALTNSPRHLAKANLSSPLAGERLTAALEAQFMSSRSTVQGGHAPSRTVTNFVLTSREWAKGLFLSGGVYNLFGVDYGDPVGGEFVQDTIPQDGRNVRLQLRVQF